MFLGSTAWLAAEPREGYSRFREEMLGCLHNYDTSHMAEFHLTAGENVPDTAFGQS
jgi:hypothetical protein